MTRWAWLLVLSVTGAVWAPVLAYDWVITWDDAAIFAWNPHVRTWDWAWMATTQYYGHWMPLTWLSATLNYALGGLHPASWHAVNVALHTVTAVLVYFIAARLVGSVSGAVVAALLFSIHPLRMESVAWITERKDVLMGVFFLGAILLWMQGRRGWSFAVFVAACAAKSPAVILPLWLLAYEWWRHRGAAYPSENRVDGAELFRRGGSALLGPGTLRRLAPFFAVSVIVTAMAFGSLHTILVSMPWSSVPLGPRLLHVAYSEVFYLMQTVWPARLSALIEYTWAPSWDQPQYPLAIVVVLLGAVVMWRTRRQWPALTAAAVAYTIAVLPQSGFFQNGPQLVANRYSYLACIPVALLVGGLLTRAHARWPGVSLVTAVAVLAALIVRTEGALPMWTNGDALWQYAALHEPTCTQCQDMATAADYRHGDLEAARRHQVQAITVSATTMMPRWERHWNLAAILVQLGRPDEAITELRTYLAAVPVDRYENPGDRDHMERARAWLARLETSRL